MSVFAVCGGPFMESNLHSGKRGLTAFIGLLLLMSGSSFAGPRADQAEQLNASRRQQPQPELPTPQPQGTQVSVSGNSLLLNGRKWVAQGVQFLGLLSPTPTPKACAVTPGPLMRIWDRRGSMPRTPGTQMSCAIR